MPKVVDHAERRRELGAAVWRVIRRDGIDRASVRAVAREAGWSAGALRHYFASQAELLDCAMQLVVERVTARVAALVPPDDPRAAAEQLLHELLPLDADRVVESEVFFAFAGRALIDPGLRQRQRDTHDALRRACTAAVEAVRAGAPLPAERAALEAERLHAVLDGLAFHAVVRPEQATPARIAEVLGRHLDALAP